MIDTSLTHSEASLQPEGIRAWLPALAIVIGLPLLALTTTKYILLPPFQHSWNAKINEVVMNCTVKPYVATIALDGPFNAGIKSVCLVGDSSVIKNTVERHRVALKELAEADLSNVASADLQGDAALRTKKNQLMQDFNRELGIPLVKEVCLAAVPGR